MELATAIESGTWTRALWLALEAWRAHRDVRLAELIDLIAARVEPPPRPKPRFIHAWWMSLAEPYNASALAALVEDASRQLGAGDNATDRLDAILAWPDDPRTATLLCGWLLAVPVRWDPLDHGTRTEDFYTRIAERLATLGDARIVPRLEACLLSPTAPTKKLRYHQSRLATDVIRRLATRAVVPVPPRELETALAGWLDDLGTKVLVPPVATGDIDALWAQIANHRDDLELRKVLGDALIERGDTRGELIALQCAGTAAATAKAKKLVNASWQAWLGELALALNRNGTEFRDGMLERVRVGVPKSPEWVFAKVHGHRELATVRVVRPGHVRPADYATFLASPNLLPDRVAIDAPEIVGELRARRSTWTFTALEYGHHSVRDGYRYEFPPLDRTFAAIAQLVPALEEVNLAAMQWPNGVERQLAALVPRLPALLPKLRRIVLDPQWLDRNVALRTMPLVVADSG